MKKSALRMLAIILTLCTLFAIPAIAATKASYQFSAYELIPTYTSNGELSAYVMISATGPMDKLGCTKIRIYEKIGSAWSLVGSFSESDTGMMLRDAFYFSVTKYCDANENSEYKVEATIYAKDYSGGSDTRTITTYLYT